MRRSGKNWVSAHRLEIALAVIFLAVGFLIGLFTNYRLNFKFKLSEETDAADILSIVSTIVLAWFVASVLDKQKHAESTSKETLVKRVEEIHAYAGVTVEKAVSENFLYSEAAAATKSVKMRVKNIYALARSIDIVIDESIKVSIMAEADKLNALMTDYNSLDPASPVQVVAGKVSFNPQRKLEIEHGFEQLKTKLTSLSLAISRS